MKTKTTELLEPQKKGHPITYNHYFTDCIQKARDSHLHDFLKKRLREFFPKPAYSQTREQHTFNIDELVHALTNRTETDMEKFACSEATDCMIAYYKVCEVNYATKILLTAFAHRLQGKSSLTISAILLLRNTS